MNINISIEGQDRVIATLQRIASASTKVTGAALYQEAEALIADAKSGPDMPVDLGTLRSSGFVRTPKIAGNKVVVECGFGGAAAGYAVYVHEGTGPAVGHAPYFPPPSALEDWANKHGLSAWAVARGIYLHGTRPRKYLETPAKARARGMVARLSERIKQMVSKGQG